MGGVFVKIVIKKLQLMVEILKEVLSTPSSDMSGKPKIKAWLLAHPEIKIIVDLGPGAATYPKFMCEDGDNPIQGITWKAVEIWAPYVERFNLNRYYSEIRIGDIRYMELPEGDCC